MMNRSKMASPKRFRKIAVPILVPKPSTSSGRLDLVLKNSFDAAESPFCHRLPSYNGQVTVKFSRLPISDVFCEATFFCVTITNKSLVNSSN